MENFIPHPEPVPFVQIFDYNDAISDKMKNGIFLPVAASQTANSGNCSGLLASRSPTHISAPFNTNNQRNQTEKRSLTADKLKYILGSHLPTNVEVMYKDAEGNFVPVNEEVLQNLANKEGKFL